MTSLHLRTLLAAVGVTLVASACSSSPSSAPRPTSATTASIDCTKVLALQGEITAAQTKMVDNGSTTPTQISDAVERIATATRDLGQLSRGALPRETVIWVTTTNAYASQIAGGAKTGTGVSELLMEAHAFNSAGYRNAARAVGSYFSAACPH